MTPHTDRGHFHAVRFYEDDSSGYSMGSFYKDASIEDITRQHTHVVTASGEAAAVA